MSYSTMIKDSADEQRDMVDLPDAIKRSFKQYNNDTSHDVDVGPNSPSASKGVRNNVKKPEQHPTRTTQQGHRHDNTKNTVATIWNRSSGWILALFVFCVLGWVATWTILAAHTDAARMVVYPALESKYFADKAGAKVFTYFGVFYLLAGVVILSFLAMGVQLPKPPLCLVQRTFRVPPATGFFEKVFGGGCYWTTLELCVLAVFVGVQVATIVTRVELKFHDDYVPDWDSTKLWYEVAKTLGKTSAITMVFLFLPVSKSCFWLDVFNYKFERAVKFHRWLAWFLVIVVLVHAAAAITSLSIAGQFKNCMWPSDSCESPDYQWGTYNASETSHRITYGWIAGLVATPLVVTSLPWFRRHRFEWFYYTHFLFVPMLVLVHLHYHDMIYYAAPGLAAYTLDKVCWWFSTRRPIKLVSLTTPAPGFVRMVIALERGHMFEPGQWVQIKVPAVSLLQWHPMSVASAPGHSTITIDVKVLGDWTQRLQDLAHRFDPTKAAHGCVFLDQFHGNSHEHMTGYLNHPAVLMFAGGIGITPMLSALRMLVDNMNVAANVDNANVVLPKVRRLVLVWCVKKVSVLKLYREELARIQHLERNAHGCQVDVIVHATLSEPEDEAASVAVDVEGSTQDTEMKCRKSPAPFMQHLMGYGHKLMLTLGAGGGYLLGIFLANLFALDHGEWRFEYVTLAQLSLALAIAAALVVIGMSGPFFRPSAVWPVQNSNHSQETHRSGNENHPPHELDVTLGCRPDVAGIVNDMHKWCLADDSTSVGVAVCGPERLIQSVMMTCREASSSSVQFVVDDETFEW